MSDYQAIRAGAEARSDDDTGWLILADWCADHGREAEAELLRAWVGVRTDTRRLEEALSLADETMRAVLLPTAVALASAIRGEVSADRRPARPST